jgi:hypothetical protein
VAHAAQSQRDGCRKEGVIDAVMTSIGVKDKRSKG